MKENQKTEPKRMSEAEAIGVIWEAMEQSRSLLAELVLLAPKVFLHHQEHLGEYYGNLENRKKEIQSCEVAIQALKEVQLYHAIGSIEELQALKQRGTKNND